MVGTMFTRSNGDFEFVGITPGTYYLEVQENGFEPVRDAVEVVSSSLFGVTVYLKKAGEAPGESGDSVSVRELRLPREARTAFRKGMEVLYTKKDPAASLTIFQQVAANAPDFYEASFHMGVAYNQLERWAEAEASFRKSVAGSEEKYPQAMIGLASLLTTREKPAEAEPLVRRALTLDATLWQGHYELARALAALGRPAEAEKCLADVVKLNSDYAPAYLLLANIHIRMKNHAALLSDLNEYLKLEPNGPQSAQARKTRDTIQRAMENAKNAPGAAPPKP
jgi:tetratricopeptide (TPR) repeat protein